MSEKTDIAAIEDFVLERFLPYRLSLLSNTVSEGIATAYRKQHGLSVTEWRVVAVLGRFPGQTASEIVKRTAMDKVSVSRAVKRLQLKGLVERKPRQFVHAVDGVSFAIPRGRTLSLVGSKKTSEFLNWRKVLPALFIIFSMKARAFCCLASSGPQSHSGARRVRVSRERLVI